MQLHRTNLILWGEEQRTISLVAERENDTIRSLSGKQWKKQIDVERDCGRRSVGQIVFYKDGCNDIFPLEALLQICPIKRWRVCSLVLKLGGSL